MAQVIIERMKSAAEAIWDMKNKLVVSLPYAHLLTRIFSHLDIDLKGELMEKMGQPIRSRNLKKSGFSLIGNVWTKTSIAESEAIIGEVPEDPPVQEEEVAVREEEPPAPERRIEDIAPEHIEPIVQSIEEIVPPTVLAPAIVEDVIAEGAAHFEGELEDTHIEETPNVLEVEATLKEIHDDTVAEVVARGHTKDVQMVDALAQGEPEVELEIQGEHTASAPADQFQEGQVEDTSDDNVEPAVSPRNKSKGAAPKVPLLTRIAHHRSRKKKIHSTRAKEIEAVKNELQEMRSELDSLNKLVTDLSDFVRVQLSAPIPPAPTQSVPEAEQAKILSIAESKTEDHWARANKALYKKLEVARINIFPPKDHPLTLSEWFVCQHRDTWGPFIQKENKFIRQFQMYQDYYFVNRLLEVQLGRFRGAIALLRTENPINTPLQVDFATLKMPKIAFLPKLHFLFMESEVGPIIFERFARVMARMFFERGTPLAFHRFIFREYQRGFIKAAVLAPILSESERFDNSCDGPRRSNPLT
ncbi:hypothetical protein Taro_033079 [Colocasia esculenta]|uniref:Uncharacterized protein n=1 Tax=Colocasia esculenta TaxID=4460 RepID=A0A843VZ43_COLES|nr:hypothetical protein [Colocasia esculenta]